jgi:hypothetical protein
MNYVRQNILCVAYSVRLRRIIKLLGDECDEIMSTAGELQELMGGAVVNIF